MNTVFLGGRSAYEYWHGLRTIGHIRLEDSHVVRRPAVRATRLGSVAPAVPSDNELRELLDGGDFGGLRLPLELMVATPSGRRESLLKTCRVWSGPLAAGSFVRVGDHAYVSSPEFLVLQMARELRLTDVAAFAYELCGFYAVRHWGAKEAARCRPLTTARALKTYANRMAGAPGVEKIQRMLRFLRDGSASPMETAVVLLLCLPHRLGGYGLPFPRMNAAVDIPVGLRRVAGETTMFCDAYWEDARFAMEYDGRLYHEGSEKVHRDHMRANRLRALGVGVEVLTRADVYRVQAFDAAAHRIAQALGVRLRRLDDAWFRRRDELRARLLKSPVTREVGDRRGPGFHVPWDSATERGTTR